MLVLDASLGFASNPSGGIYLCWILLVDCLVEA